jgi:hypothetical protein
LGREVPAEGLVFPWANEREILEEKFRVLVRNLVGLGAVVAVAVYWALW